MAEHNSPAVHRDLGRHDAEISQLKDDVADIKDDVRIIRETLATARGGWKTLLLVAGISSTVGALASKVAVWLHLIPGRP